MKRKKCKNCQSSRLVKNGKSNQKQRFLCKSCGKTFQLDNSKSYPCWFINEAVYFHNEGLPYRAIARKLKVCPATVLNWIRKESKKVILPQPKHCGTIEIDELQFFLGNKNQRRWLWIALVRETNQILAVHVGGRSKKDFEIIWNKIRKIDCLKYCTDRYEVYSSFLSSRVHFRGKRYTFTIEGLMSVVRHFLARFRRKTRCYSRNLEMVLASILVFAEERNRKLKYDP